MSVLFKNARILVRNEKGYESFVGYLGVNEDRIDYLGESAPDKKYDEVKDYSNKLKSVYNEASV